MQRRGSGAGVDFARIPKIPKSGRPMFSSQPMIDGGLFFLRFVSFVANLYS